MRESEAMSESESSFYQFELELTGAHPSEDTPTSYTGAAFQGRVQLTFREAVHIRSFVVKLSYRVSGSGSPETHELVQQEFEVGDVQAERTLAKRVMLSVPESAPMSYEGAYIKIVWSVALEIWLDTEDCFIEEVPVLVLPRPVEFDASDESPQAQESVERGLIKISNIQPQLSSPSATEPAVSVKTKTSGPVLDIMDPARDMHDIESSDNLIVPQAEGAIPELDVMDLPDEQDKK